MAQWHNGTISQWHNSMVAQWHASIVAQWHKSTMVQWHSVTCASVPLCHCAIEPLCHGAMVQQHTLQHTTAVGVCMYVSMWVYACAYVFNPSVLLALASKFVWMFLFQQAHELPSPAVTNVPGSVPEEK